MGYSRSSGRDLEEEQFVLSMVDGHLEFLGKGEIYNLDSEQNKIIILLAEEHRPMSTQEIMKAMGIQGDTHYQRFRKVLYRLYCRGSYWAYQAGTLTPVWRRPRGGCAVLKNRFLSQRSQSVPCPNVPS